MATIAPVVMSVVVWIVTQSALALIFAGLGPIVAIGSFADSRVQSRRRASSEKRRFAAELEEAHRRRVELHAEEIAERETNSPSAPSIVHGGSRWAVVGRARGRAAISLGRGDCASLIECDNTVVVPNASSTRPSATGGAANSGGIAELIAAASTVHNAPLTVDVVIPGSNDRESLHDFFAARVIGIAGAGALAAAVARSIAVQICALLPPDRFSITANALPHNWDWLADLPHELFDTTPDRPGLSSNGPDGIPRGGGVQHDDVPRTSILEWRAESGEESRLHALRIVLARSLDSLPHDCDVILDVRGAEDGNIVEHPDARLKGRVSWETVSEAQARAWANAITAEAMHEGRSSDDSPLPTRVELAQLRGRAERADATPVTSTLPCEFVVDGHGPFAIDLVADGPHAIVGGTTGSGKSELLIAWVVALASRFGPAEFTVLLVDFKGGSSFGNLTDLPQCVGLLTDLDDSTAKRALESLAAELRYRERALFEASARSIDDSPELHKLPRLVIVVDEFAAMANEHPDLNALFSDIAARGRSLGVHLILCTQRPAGVIRDTIFANSGLRISLRVNNKADSTAVINSDAAALLSATLLGRAILVQSGGEPRAVQCAIAAPSDVDLAVREFSAEPAPRRPWLDPLPARITLSEIARRWEQKRRAEGLGEPHLDYPGGEVEVPWGLSDQPHRQEQPIATWRPTSDGHVLVIGQGRSGKSSTLHAFHAAIVATDDSARVDAAATPESAWDAVTDALGAVRSGRDFARRYILIDDLDALLPRLGSEHQAELADTLEQLLREGPARGVYCVITVHRVTSPLQRCALLMGNRLILSVASRQDHVVVGGEPQLFRSLVPPGAGSWRGAIVQVAWNGGDCERGEPRVENFSPAESFAVVTNSPRAFMARLGLWCEHNDVTLDVVKLGTRGASESPLVGLDSGDEVSISAGDSARVIIGDPESWQSHWGALEQARARGAIVFDGCSLGDFRTLTRVREVPPPIAASSGQFWLLTPDRNAVRACLG